MGRALAALEREGLRRVPGPDLRLEYPVAARRDGTLLLGYVDLLASGDGEATWSSTSRPTRPPHGT